MSRFKAIHIPVQAPADLIAKYKGRYDAGWDVLRRERQQRAEALWLVPPGAAMADLPPGYRRWVDLSDEDRVLYAARMEVQAAMLEAMDRNIGRLIAHLKASGQYDDTIFVFASDNVLCQEAAAGFGQQISMRRQPSARHAI